MLNLLIVIIPSTNMFVLKYLYLHYCKYKYNKYWLYCKLHPEKSLSQELSVSLTDQLQLHSWSFRLQSPTTRKHPSYFVFNWIFASRVIVYNLLRVQSVIGCTEDMFEGFTDAIQIISFEEFEFVSSSTVKILTTLLLSGLVMSSDNDANFNLCHEETEHIYHSHSRVF